MAEQVAVIGLGYVGLPVALALAGSLPGTTLGFDVDSRRVDELRQGFDRTGEASSAELAGSGLKLTSDPEDLTDATFFVVAVPTPIDRNNRPDLAALISASNMVGHALRPGAIVVYESTVYPGVTEEVCGPVLAQTSGLKQGTDFKLGYSPERINPGDKEHTLRRIVKVVAGEDDETLDKVAEMYETIVEAGVHRAPNIKVAEAAKVIENIQRDLNIALMNELALIFDRMGVRTRDVLEAAGTKWNFLPFTPGLVGGHCVGVDPFYLTTKAEEIGYHPQVILAGRRINDGMGTYVAQRVVKLLINADMPVKGARLGLLGLTFKENVSDLRNSRVPDIVTELRQFGVEPLVHDPLADPLEALREYGIVLTSWREFEELDGVILAVNHDFYLSKTRSELLSLLRPDGVLADVKGVFDPNELPDGLHYWSL